MGSDPGAAIWHAAFATRAFLLPDVACLASSSSGGWAPAPLMVSPPGSGCAGCWTPIPAGRRTCHGGSRQQHGRLSEHLEHWEQRSPFQHAAVQYDQFCDRLAGRIPE